MMVDVIVIGSLGLSAAFFIAWLTRADFRAWVERPKYAFDERARRYDRAVVHPAATGNAHAEGSDSK